MIEEKGMTMKMTLARWLMLGTVLLIATGSVIAADKVAADFFVSPTGNDAWSGTLAEQNADANDGPFATLARAQQAVRELIGSGRSGPVLVLFRDGTYWLSEPITFKPANSGRADAPITYAAYPGEKAIFSGGRRIDTEWKRNDNGSWTTTLKRPGREEWYFRQLFVNGQRAIRVRTPNQGFLETDGVIPGVDPKGADRQSSRARRGFRYKPGDIQKRHQSGDIQVVVDHSWTTTRHWIESLDEANRVVQFVNPTGWPFGYFEKQQRYFIENDPEALDAPGEWYLDRWESTLTYIPREGEDVPTAEFIAPLIRQLMILDGDRVNGDYVHHITFKGLSFQHADCEINRDYFGDGQAAWTLTKPAIMADGTQYVDLVDCEVAHVGEYAIHFNRGCAHNRIVNCHAHDLGAGGIGIGTTDKDARPYDASEYNLVENCLIHDGGRIFPAGVGVLVGRANYTTVSHNEIFNLGYTGVSVGWKWGIEKVSTSHHNTIEYNHIYKIGDGRLSDMAGIYTLGKQTGTVLRNNLIHDVQAVLYGGNGMYNDSRCEGVLMENNIVYRCNDSTYHLNHGTYNVLRNNILAFAGRAEVTTSNREDPPPTITVERNIIYTALPRMHAYEMMWTAKNYAFDYNLYYRAGGEPFDWPGDRTFEQWQEWTGQDKHSIVADPLFLDPENGDFRLKPGSPAEKIGFQPIDVSQIGRRKTNETK